MNIQTYGCTSTNLNSGIIVNMKDDEKIRRSSPE
jgi:hypothetical protein